MSPDKVQARQWLDKAIALKVAGSSVLAPLLLAEGPAQAATLQALQARAEHNDEDALYALSWVYRFGISTPADAEQAANWYRRWQASWMGQVLESVQ
ncbi:hypothetical protein [Vogesella indigofera]|uniref:hypothetical protein n=1 Tax=Vogesella indigofera TaxID=45465 RepID=UPI003F437AB4